MQAVGSSMTALLVAVAAASPVRLSRGVGNGDRGARLERVWSCAARSTAGLKRAHWSRTQAERRHGTNDIGNATNGSSGEAEKTKKTKLWRQQVQTTRSCRGKRVTAVEMAVQAAAVMTAAMTVLTEDGASSAGRDKEIGGGGKEEFLT
jgi:hypothetical protein